MNTLHFARNDISSYTVRCTEGWVNQVMDRKGKERKGKEKIGY